MLEEIKYISQDHREVRIRDHTSVDSDNIVEAASFMHTQRQRTVLIFISEGKFHLVAVSVFAGAGQDPFKPAGDLQILLRYAGEPGSLLHRSLKEPLHLSPFQSKLLFKREMQIHTAAAAAEMRTGSHALDGGFFDDLLQISLSFSPALFGHAKLNFLSRKDIFDNAESFGCLYDAFAWIIHPCHDPFQNLTFFHKSPNLFYPLILSCLLWIYP